MNNKRIAFLGLFVALAFVLSYIEYMLPLNIGIPGAKVGFASSDFSIGENVRIIGFPPGRDIAQVVRLSGDNNTYVGLRVTFLGCAYMQVPLNRIIKIDKS